tara:strand:- start:713 stop:1099 length:387 start_codon:yes stop_codon:yes gene_type:complete
MTTYTLTEAQRQQLLDVSLSGVSTANTLATNLLQSLTPQAAPSTSPEPVYQYQLINGNWIDQPKEIYDYIATLGQATVRELFTHPAPSTSQPLTPREIGALVGTHEFGPEQLKWFRLGEAAHGIKGGA